MNDIAAKVAHVKSQGQTRDHHCHWPGCEKQVPPAMWGCTKHWYSLPQRLRNLIWATYRPGQEATGRPSSSYLDAANQVQAWIRENAKPIEKPKPRTDDGQQSIFGDT